MFELKLPALGADMDQGTLLAWKVQPGDPVHKGQVVAVVDTVKAAIDVEIWQDGTVQELLVEPGSKIPVGTVLAMLRTPGETEGAIAAPPASAAAGERRRISPAARQRALALGLDPARLQGSGPAGAVTLADVERAAAAAPAPAAPAPAGGAADMRAAIGAAMSRSKREIPHYYLLETIPLGQVRQWLAQVNADRPLAERLLPAVLLLKAVALALKRYPEFHGFYENGGFRPASGVHLGVAVSLRQGGLIAPALLDADRKPLDQLMRELADLVVRARAGRLRSSEISEASITVTNLGDLGVETVIGVIQPPQVALVGFGRIDERPWVLPDGQLGAMPVVTASLSADHRVSDGHRGGLFLAELRELLQQPQRL